jgi:hexokinase
VQAPQAEGELIGENLARALHASGSGKKHVVILNDTVTTLLAGTSTRWGRDFDGFIGFILGTGTNSCYLERNAEITKRSDLDMEQEQIINVESGGFNRVQVGSLDQEFDQDTVDPGLYTFEKMVSGAYFGPLCLRAAQQAAREALFSRSAAGALLGIERVTTEHIDEFLSSPCSDRHPLGAAVARGGEHDPVLLFHIIDLLMDRAALLSAAHLSAVVCKSNRGKDPCMPVCVTAEGSVFHGLKTLRRRVECALQRFLIRGKERYPEIVSVKNATLIGAAVAGLTN